MKYKIFHLVSVIIKELYILTFKTNCCDAT